MPSNSNFDKVGININTGTIYDKDGFTIHGFDKNKLHKDTRTKYDNDGFDSAGYNQSYNTREDIENSKKVITLDPIEDEEIVHVLPKIKLGLLDRFKKIGIENRNNDEVLYEYVSIELERGMKFKGLWAKAYANSEGNTNKIEPLYMQYRVQAIKDMLTSLEISYNEMSKKVLFTYLKNKLT